ncbi:MAG: peptidoglycan DD-metalloendopeptidase family protein [Ketobacteraceae bacterium]|nr:peptidoglycan DD-metalloendopeptidase family protein [Ketobacteraceae bacterium]
MHFHRTRLAPLLLSLTLTVSLLLWWPLTVHGDSDVVDAQKTEKELSQVKKKIQSLQHVIKKTQSRRSETEEDLRKVELEISNTRKDLRDASQQIRKSRSTVVRLNQEKARLEAAKSKQKKALIADIQAAYRTGRQEYIKLLLNQQEPEKLARVIKYYDYFHRTRLDNIQSFNNTLTSLEENQQQLNDELERLQNLKLRLEIQQEGLIKAKSQRKKVLQKLDVALRDKDKKLSQLNENQEELQRLLRAVQETLADLPADVGNTTPFAQRKGKLKWPTEGRVARSFHSRRDDSNLRWNGVVIRTENGAPVKSVHRGRVVFSDWLRGFGLLTIVDHGDNYYTLYGHNESLLTEPGDWVEAGQVIAFTGTSGGQERPGLYFEIRKDGNPVNPSHWCRG